MRVGKVEFTISGPDDAIDGALTALEQAAERYVKRHPEVSIEVFGEDFDPNTVRRDARRESEEER